MNKWLVGLTCAVVGAATAWGQSVVINEIRNDAPDAVELVVVQDGLNMQGMIVKDYSSSGANDGGGAFTFSTDPLWASLPAGTIIVLQKTNTATDVTVGGGDYNLTVGLQNATYFTAGSGTFDIATEEIIQIKAAGNDQAGSTGAIHTLATDGAGAQYDSSPTPKLKAASGDSGFPESVEANNSTAALSDFNGTDATGDNATGTIGTYNNANNQTFIDGLRGPATFGVTFDKTTGFEVEQGTTEVITATAANGTAPYGYAWSSSLGGAYYATNANEFTIQSTAPLGDYSAQVIATDATAASVTNTIAFSVVAPAVTYAIAIVTNAPENGTVATTPATEAAEGATVTVNAVPAGGYAVDSIVVVDAGMNPVTVTGNTFTMPASAVTVTVTFQEIVADGELIISQYYEGSGSYNKWVEIYNPGATAIDLAAGGYRLGSWNNAARETWKTDGAPTLAVALSNSIAAGGTYVIGPASASNPVYAVANQNANWVFNGDDSVVLYTGETYAFANVVDAFGLTANTAADKSYVRKDTITAGMAADFNAADWDDFTVAEVEAAAEMTNERLGYHSTGPAVFNVSFDKASGFTVEQGASDAITATAANGTAPYGYVWTSSLGEGYRTADANVFTILATAPLGDYTAQVVATDSSDPVQSVTNSLNFSVVAPPTKYAIAIVTNAPANGTVTTTPATEAAAGATVTVNATPAGGYAVESIVVNGGAVTVTGNTFVMPAEPATVTVTFMEYTAPDVLITFETGTLPSAYAANTATLEDGKVWSTMRVVKSNSDNDKKIDTLSARLYPQTGTNAVLQQTEAYAEPISEISYWVASYGSDNMANVTLAVEVSSDGTNWETAETLTGADDITATLTEHVVATVPANAVYVRFVATAEAASNKRINLDNIGFNMGAASFGVSLNKSNGFEVQEGQSDSIIATAANGTTPYSYEWDSTLGAMFYNASGDAFTILATAPTGSYSATVTATDAALATAQKTVTFSVVGLGPGPAVIIAGSRTGTVGVPMELTISVTNETAEEWFVDLKDPTGADAGWDYANFPPTFSMTPTMTGTYVLVVTAQTGSGNVTNTANLVIGAGDGDEVWTIGDGSQGSTMFYATSNKTVMIILPTNYTLNAVYGTDSSSGGLNNLGQGLGTPLAENVDYNWNPATRTISVLSGVTNRRVLRIGATPE